MSAEKNDFESIEHNKDKTNMRPALRFIEENWSQYESNVNRFLSGEHDESRAFAQAIEFVNVPDEGNIQLSPEEVRRIIACVSPELIKLSALKQVDYKWSNSVAVPGFDENGKLDLSKVRVKTLEEFASGDDHHQRMLVGNTARAGDIINMSAIPPSVSMDPVAVRLFQIHVFLHEFFHTIELPRRNAEASAKVQLNGGTRTLADWSADYLASLNEEPILTTEYAEVYRPGIFDGQNKVKSEVTPYDAAVREDMAEAWVASHLDIISNPHGYTSFASYPFGNTGTAVMLRDHGVASRKAALMNELRNATIMQIAS